MKIGEVAHRARGDAKTIRYYEQVGVLSPPDRSRSGYRDYGADVLERLEFIRAAQAVGLTLAEIRGVIEVRNAGTVPCSHVISLLRRKTDEIEIQIAALQRTTTRPSPSSGGSVSSSPMSRRRPSKIGRCSA